MIINDNLIPSMKGSPDEEEEYTKEEEDGYFIMLFVCHPGSVTHSN